MLVVGIHVVAPTSGPTSPADRSHPRLSLLSSLSGASVIGLRASPSAHARAEEGIEPSRQPTTGVGVPPGISHRGRVTLFALARLLLSRLLPASVAGLVARAKRRSFSAHCPPIGPGLWPFSHPRNGLYFAAAPKGRGTLTFILPRASRTRGRRLTSRHTRRGARRQLSRAAARFVSSGQSSPRPVTPRHRGSGCSLVAGHQCPCAYRAGLVRSGRRDIPPALCQRRPSGSAAALSCCPSRPPFAQTSSSSSLAPRCRTAPSLGWRVGLQTIHATGLIHVDLVSSRRCRLHHRDFGLLQSAATSTRAASRAPGLGCPGFSPPDITIAAAGVLAHGSRARQATGGIEPPGQLR